MESVAIVCAFIFICVVCSAKTIPATIQAPKYGGDDTNFDIESFNDTTNGTARDLYVIRTVIYEVGILTDADNDTSDSSETHEQVDLTFYDPKRNGSFLDLSSIPIPYQTNVSGQVITGIAPANFGKISLNSTDFKENGTEVTGRFPLKAPIYPNVLITRTNNVSTTDPDQERSILEDLATELLL